MTKTEQLRTKYKSLLIELGDVHDQIDEAGEEAWEGPLADTEELADSNNSVAIELAAGREAIMTEGESIVREQTVSENVIGSMDLAGRC